MQQMDSLHPIDSPAPKPLEALAAHLPSGSRLWCPADGCLGHLAFVLCGAVVPPLRTQEFCCFCFSAFGIVAAQLYWEKKLKDYGVKSLVHWLEFLEINRCITQLSFGNNCLLPLTFKIRILLVTTPPPPLSWTTKDMLYFTLPPSRTLTNLLSPLLHEPLQCIFWIITNPISLWFQLTSAALPQYGSSPS